MDSPGYHTDKGLMLEYDQCLPRLTITRFCSAQGWLRQLLRMCKEMIILLETRLYYLNLGVLNYFTHFAWIHLKNRVKSARVLGPSSSVEHPPHQRPCQAMLGGSCPYGAWPVAQPAVSRVPMMLSFNTGDSEMYGSYFFEPAFHRRKQKMLCDQFSTWGKSSHVKDNCWNYYVCNIVGTQDWRLWTRGTRS